MKRCTVFMLLLFIALSAAAQTNQPRKHIIYFTNKTGTPFSVDQPQAFLSPRSLERRDRQNIEITERDLPVNPTYVQKLKGLGADVWYTSRWFNAAVVVCDSSVLVQLKNQPFVKNSESLNRIQKLSQSRRQYKLVTQAPVLRLHSRAEYGSSFHQNNMIGAIDLHQEGFQGEGMLVAVFDAGFPNVDQIPAFQHLYQNNQLKYTYDFVGNDQDVYERSSHGTMVLSTMAAQENGSFIGTAPKADYMLFITEDADSEHHIEEINWLIAAERADSAGVDVINSSLGYTTFDPPSADYTYQDMNGDRTLVTRAADFAAAAGILVVNSAGNEGHTQWRYISAPADGDSVLAVAAVDSAGHKAIFSSFGPSVDGRIKPNLAAMGQLAAVISPSGVIGRANGTSFAGPILCGMVTCFWQTNRSLTNYEVIMMLQQTASQASNPDTLIGYGIPNAMKALRKMKMHRDEVIIYPNPVMDEEITLSLPEGMLEHPVDIIVYDMVGRMVHRETLPQGKPFQKLQLNTASLTNGLYICVINGSEENKVLRLVKH